MAAKDECETLMRDMLPFARSMLREYGEFHPFGGTMSQAGRIRHVGVESGLEFPEGAAVRSILLRTFQAEAAELQATAIVCDVRIAPPGEERPRDAIQVELDHRDGYSARVFFPYLLSAAGDLSTEPPFACQGDGVIFRGAR